MQIVWSENAFAYLDPGAGSFVYQVIISFFLGGLLSFKIFSNKIKAFLDKIFNTKRYK